MFPGCAGPSCPRVRVFNMRPSPGIVNGHSTTYGVFVLGQSLDVDIVEKLKIRQIRKCPDEIGPAHLYRMVDSGRIPYQRGYGTRARARYGPGMGDGLFLVRPNAVRPAQPALFPAVPGPPGFPGPPAPPARPGLPGLPGLPSPTYKAGGRLVFRPPPVVHRQDVWKVGCPPAERQRNEVATRQSNGNASRVPSKCRHIRSTVLGTCVHRVATVHVATAHRVRRGVSRTPTGCDSCRNSSAREQTPAGSGVGKTAPWRYDDTVGRGAGVDGKGRVKD